MYKVLFHVSVKKKMLKLLEKTTLIQRFQEQKLLQIITQVHQFFFCRQLKTQTLNNGKVFELYELNLLNSQWND